MIPYDLDIFYQELANESGFRSYATFGLAFKRFMGQTVTSWIKEDS
jgi:AraC-like DNA-binding protein